MTSWYCPLPFKHVFIDTDGISPCCNTRESFTLALGVDEYLNTPQLKALQNKFLQGQQPSECRYCFRQESIQNKSMRLDASHDYDHQIYKNSQIDFVHFSPSNLCNFKCRSCGPQYSHLIAQEVQTFGLYDNTNMQESMSKYLKVDVQQHHWIIDNLHQIKRLLLTGGEPTVMPEVKKILEYVQASSNLEIQIMITTNCSWSDDFWYELIATMPNLHITASVDAVGSAAELIRNGTQWSQVEKNLHWLAKKAHSLDINTVVGCLSIVDMYPLLKFCSELQQESKIENGGRQGSLGLRHQFSVCFDELNGITHFPDNIKKIVVQNLNRCLELPLDEEQTRTVTGLIKTVQESEFDAESWQLLQKYHQHLDRIRNENHSSLLLPKTL